MNEVSAEVYVPLDRARAFELFTRDVEMWWHRGERYGGSEVVGRRFEPWVGGRFVEELAGGEQERGRVTAWSPPTRLAFSWRQSNWLPHEVTEVEVTFVESGDGTRVRLRHSGFDAISSGVGCDVGYRAGWAELLGWFTESVKDRRETPCT